jgi:SPW repeat
MLRHRTDAILDVYKLLLGAFLFVSPWLFAFAHSVAGTDVWVSGAAIAAASIAALLMFAEWEEWVMLVGGLWLVLSPFALGFQHTTAMHLSIGIGLAVSYLAALKLWLRHYGPQPN